MPLAPTIAASGGVVSKRDRGGEVQKYLADAEKMAALGRHAEALQRLGVSGGGSEGFYRSRSRVGRLRPTRSPGVRPKLVAQSAVWT